MKKNGFLTTLLTITILMTACASSGKKGASRVKQRIIEACITGDNTFEVTFRLLLKPEHRLTNLWHIKPDPEIVGLKNKTRFGRPTATYIVRTRKKLDRTAKYKLTIAIFLKTTILGKRPKHVPFKGEIKAIMARYPGWKPKTETLFIGSSSFTMWRKLEQDLKRFGARNHGFGGSMLWMLNHYYPRIVKPFKPSRVVVYCGENDIAAGFKPKEVLRQFTILFKRLRRDFPGIPVYYCTMKPSPARWHLWEKFKKGNMMVRLFCDETQGAHFIDVSTPMLDDKGLVRSDIWKHDKLHMNRRGYTDIWIPVITNRLLGRKPPKILRKRRRSEDRW